MKYTTLNFDHLALLTIDMQNDFLKGQSQEAYETTRIIPQLVELIDNFRKLKKPIVHMVRIYFKDGSNADLCRRENLEMGGKMLLPDADGCQLVMDLLPKKNIRLRTELLLKGGVQNVSPNEVIIYKPRWGAFYHTALKKYLDKIKVNSLIITGCVFPNCPRATIYEASERDFKIGIVPEVLSGIYEKGIEEMKAIEVNIYSARNLINEMERHAIGK
ncbi:cysteine hydrolase family protein [Xanthovirga aplysinae]|uniref:cysteine hydrolase family protein n=1 Tax=Xanthovirga aplysinae TaxID=2529853 RepID=UPI0012BCA507|nr:isochorismatase family cysteine hydrolase [Xanthovirga aplysinae]MTI30104.1 cysteine hydrolase [Xanthovirga aplysinae]